MNIISYYIIIAAKTISEEKKNECFIPTIIYPLAYVICVVVLTLFIVSDKIFFMGIHEYSHGKKAKETEFVMEIKEEGGTSYENAKVDMEGIDEVSESNIKESLIRN